MTAGGALASAAFPRRLPMADPIGPGVRKGGIDQGPGPPPSTADNSRQGRLGAGKFRLNLRNQRRHRPESVGPRLVFKPLRGCPQSRGTKIGGAPLDAVGGPRESRRVAGREALFEFGDALRGVLEKNIGDLAQKRVVVVGIQCPQVLDGLRVYNGGIRHGDIATIGDLSDLSGKRNLATEFRLPTLSMGIDHTDRWQAGSGVPPVGRRKSGRRRPRAASAGFRFEKFADLPLVELLHAKRPLRPFGLQFVQQADIFADVGLVSRSSSTIMTFRPCSGFGGGSDAVCFMPPHDAGGDGGRNEILGGRGVGLPPGGERWTALYLARITKSEYVDV